MLTVGLTGGVASGKSEALRLFAQAGAKTLSSDAIVKDLMRPGTAEVRRIRAHFGPKVIRSGGSVCREHLRERVMADPKELDWLERTLHPGVRRTIREHIAKHRRQEGVLVVEVPLLFENGFNRLFDRTVAVVTSIKNSEQRATQRGMSPGLYKFFSSRQWPLARKAKAADAVIRNNKGLSELNFCVKRVLANFLKQGGK